MTHLGTATEITWITQDSSVDVGTTVLITCVAEDETSESLPDIKWERDGQNILNTSMVTQTNVHTYIVIINFIMKYIILLSTNSLMTLN